MKPLVLLSTFVAVLSSTLVLSSQADPSSRPIDYCVEINENFSEDACNDPIVDEENGITRKSCKDVGVKNICILADGKTITGWETMDVETLTNDGTTFETVCTYFLYVGYSKYCTSLQTCGNGGGGGTTDEQQDDVCGFTVDVDGRSCNVQLQVCEEGVEVSSTATSLVASRANPPPTGHLIGGDADSNVRVVTRRAFVVDCPFDKDLNWNGCTDQRRNNQSNSGLHLSFMSILLADQSPSIPMEQETDNTAATSGAFFTMSKTYWFVIPGFMAIVLQAPLLLGTLFV